MTRIHILGAQSARMKACLAFTALFAVSGSTGPGAAR